MKRAVVSILCLLVLSACSNDTKLNKKVLLYEFYKDEIAQAQVQLDELELQLIEIDKEIQHATIELDNVKKGNSEDNNETAVEDAEDDYQANEVSNTDPASENDKRTEVILEAGKYVADEVLEPGHYNVESLEKPSRLVRRNAHDGKLLSVDIVGNNGNGYPIFAMSFVRGEIIELTEPIRFTPYVTREDVGK